jgi:dTMP kinase
MSPDGYTRRVTTTGEPAPRGRFITIEGPEGSGKTTQAERLATRLRDDGHRVLLTREPGGTRLGEQLRAILLARSDDEQPTDPLTDALLFEAARRHLIRHVIRPAVADGVTVVCARYADSTLAYQGFGAGVPLATLRAVDSAATDGLLPDRTILLDLPVEEGLARKAPDDLTRFEADHDLAFHRRVRDGFLALAATEPVRWVVLDARLPIDDVTEAILAAVSPLIEAASEPPTARVRISR